ncbi:hypothetical protein SLEP1_g50366 [Rubroshorea leprosula]|uniref:Uncharacterized protein n=1 Tax=Rubroshorea leprosula TaxID=152421 RepID=A0AAV5LZR8_9ROSI|nr:hypothetical protein SLEP1_g50366 [Rubroshorea leprosula]
MEYVREVGELQGNQGIEEEEYVMSVEPITMIVLPKLQDLPETFTPESSASSSAQEGGDHHTSPSSSSSSKETPSRKEETRNVVGNEPNLPVVGEWEHRVITGRLSNLRKTPKDLLVGFRFRAALHHEVADSALSISGYKKLEERVRSYQIPGTILLRAGAQNEKACTVSQTGWILVIRFIIGFMLLCARLEVPAKAIVFRSLFQCRLCPNSRGAKWYYLSGREKSQLFKNVRNNVARWKRQFIFARDMRTKRISNDLVARLSEWRVPNAHVNYPQLLPRDTDLKNQLLEYATRDNLIDLEALVTSEQLAVFGFVDVANQFTEGEMSSILEHQCQRAQGSRGRVAVSAPRIAYPEGFSYVKTDYQPTMVQGMQSFVPPMDRQRARTFVQQHGGQVTMVKLMDAFSYAVALFESEQGARTQNSELNANYGHATSRAEELTSRNNELREELERARTEKESKIQVAKDEAAQVEELAKKAEAKRDHALNDLSSLRHQVVKADKNLNAAEEVLNELKTSHGTLDLERDPWEGVATSPGLPNTQAGVLRRGGPQRASLALNSCAWLEFEVILIQLNTPPDKPTKEF